MQLITHTDITDMGIKLSQRTLRRLEQSGEFPRRLHIGRQKVAWLESEIIDWLTEKSQQR